MVIGGKFLPNEGLFKQEKEDLVQEEKRRVFEGFKRKRLRGKSFIPNFWPKGRERDFGPFWAPGFKKLGGWGKTD